MNIRLTKAGIQAAKRALYLHAEGFPMDQVLADIGLEEQRDLEVLLALYAACGGLPAQVDDE